MLSLFHSQMRLLSIYSACGGLYSLWVCKTIQEYLTVVKRQLD